MSAGETRPQLMRVPTSVSDAHRTEQIRQMAVHDAVAEVLERRAEHADFTAKAAALRRRAAHRRRCAEQLRQHLRRQEEDEHVDR